LGFRRRFLSRRWDITSNNNTTSLQYNRNFAIQHTKKQNTNTNTNNVISTAPFTPGVTNGALQLLVGLYHEPRSNMRHVTTQNFINVTAIRTIKVMSRSLKNQATLSSATGPVYLTMGHGWSGFVTPLHRISHTPFSSSDEYPLTTN